jgi:hypothetical protein
MGWRNARTVTGSGTQQKRFTSVEDACLTAVSISRIVVAQYGEHSSNRFHRLLRVPNRLFFLT